MVNRLITIAIVESDDQGKQRLAGGFCSLKDAVSDAEVEILGKLRILHTEAHQIKQQLKACLPEDKQRLMQHLGNIRQEAAQWREQKEEATRRKHAALGQVVLGLGHGPMTS